MPTGSVVPQNIPLEIVQGSTFRPQFYWTAGRTVKAIAGITVGSPTILISVGHGLPTHPVMAWFAGIAGHPSMVGLNSKRLWADQYGIMVERIDDDTFRLMQLTQGSYAGGGFLYFDTPVNLAGYSARMKIRRSRTDPVEIANLATPDGIVLDDDNGGIQPFIAAADTEVMDFESAVYDLEMVDPAGNVDRLLYGCVTLFKEVTYGDGP